MVSASKFIILLTFVRSIKLNYLISEINRCNFDDISTWSQAIIIFGIAEAVSIVTGDGEAVDRFGVVSNVSIVIGLVRVAFGFLTISLITFPIHHYFRFSVLGIDAASRK
jgi:hypothetical protein